MVFLASNYHGVQKAGIEQAYSFLTWQDPVQTAQVVLGFHALIAVIVVFSAFLSEQIKGRILPTVDEAITHKSMRKPNRP